MQIISNPVVKMMIGFIEEYAKNGCHHGCMLASCSHAGKQRAANAVSILAEIDRDVRRIEKQIAEQGQ